MFETVACSYTRARWNHKKILIQLQRARQGHVFGRQALSVSIHKRVITAMRLVRNSKYHGMNVEEIARIARVDTRTAKLHLNLLVFHRKGEWADKKHKVFIPIP